MRVRSGLRVVDSKDVGQSFEERGFEPKGPHGAAEKAPVTFNKLRNARHLI
jgi:hypothetical protein